MLLQKQFFIMYIYSFQIFGNHIHLGDALCVGMDKASELDRVRWRDRVNWTTRQVIARDLYANEHEHESIDAVQCHTANH